MPFKSDFYRCIYVRIQRDAQSRHQIQRRGSAESTVPFANWSEDDVCGVTSADRTYKHSQKSDQFLYKLALETEVIFCTRLFRCLLSAVKMHILIWGVCGD